jgi:hypothetical protein
MRHIDERAVSSAYWPTLGLEFHRFPTLTADHVAISGVMSISISVTGLAACECDVNDLVWGALDNEFHSLPRSARFEKVKLRRSQLALVQVEILAFG